MDAGYVMLVEKADATWRELLDDLFAADTQEWLERGFGSLEAESRYRRSQAEKHEREQRRKTGAPVHAKARLGGVSPEAAVAEWNEIVTAARAQAAPDAPGGDV